MSDDRLRVSAEQTYPGCKPFNQAGHEARVAIHLGVLICCRGPVVNILNMISSQNPSWRGMPSVLGWSACGRTVGRADRIPARLVAEVERQESARAADGGEGGALGRVRVRGHKAVLVVGRRSSWVSEPAARCCA